MDVIILAGGRGGRLTGVAAPYHKPLLPVNGVPLVRNCVNVLHRWRDGIESITVVTAPENTLPISQVLPKDPDITIVVQREPNGPGYGLLAGLKIGTDEQVMVLLADNIMTAGDIAAMVAHEYAVAVTTLPGSASLQFTWWDESEKMWREKVPQLENLTRPIEAWCGPLLINRAATEDAYSDIVCGWDDSRELPIGPFLGRFVPHGFHNIRVPMHCTDIGHIDYWRNENGN